MTVIDVYLPHFDANEIHQIVMNAEAAPVYAAVRELDMSRSRLIRGLFFLRGLPAFFSRNKNASTLGLNRAGLLRNGFVLLDEKPGEEMVLGLVGKFWTATGCVQKIAAREFRAFTAPGFAKAAWNFSLQRQSNGAIILTTETRILCTDRASRKRFLRYWRFVRPFSGLVRLAALRAIKRAVERTTQWP